MCRAEYTALNELTQQCPKLNTQPSVSSSENVHSWILSSPRAHPTSVWSLILNYWWAHWRVSGVEYSTPLSSRTVSRVEYSTLDEPTRQYPQLHIQLQMSSPNTIHSSVQSAKYLLANNIGSLSTSFLQTTLGIFDWIVCKSVYIQGGAKIQTLTSSNSWPNSTIHWARSFSNSSWIQLHSLCDI